VNGIYKWVRHPMLVGGLLFLLTSGPSLNNLMYTAMYTAYMLIGGYYEERRLVRIFGEDYQRYREQVGAFFPRLWRQPAA
jgi:protein-S-isoprenylcysteine O-methyltransferase Ste14